MLKDLDNLVPVLKDLGQRHTKYGVEAAHYPIVGGAFLKTLEVGLGDAYTPEVAKSFTAMWGVVESTMLSGASIEERVRQDFAANGDGLRAPQVELIKRTWKTVETLPVEVVGVLLFKHIFEAAPQAAALFSFGREPNFDTAADHSKNPAVVKHAVGVVKTVGVAIGMLTDLESLVPVLKDLGQRHTKYGVEAAHYPIVGGAFSRPSKLVWVMHTLQRWRRASLPCGGLLSLPCSLQRKRLPQNEREREI